MIAASKRRIANVRQIGKVSRGAEGREWPGAVMHLRVASSTRHVILHTRRDNR